jgi:hypothetical protein
MWCPWRRRSADGGASSGATPAVTITVLVLLLIIVVLWPYVVITVPSGRVGVYWKCIDGFDVGRGTILDPPRAARGRPAPRCAGLQSTTETINAISKDDVNVTAQINARLLAGAPRRCRAAQFIGLQYLETVVSPEIGSQAREVISKYNAEEGYSSRDKTQEQIRNGTRKSLGANLDKLVQPEATEQPDPKHYNDFLQGSIQILDILILTCLRRSWMPSIGRPSSST